MMLSLREDARISGSPKHAPPMESRRKRKALSCFDCRRRKLGCDREYPSCGRCRKAGQGSSCSYDKRSLQSRHTEPSGPSSSKHCKNTPQAPSDWSSSTPVAHVRQINRIESRPSTLEASQNAGTWQLLGRSSSATKTNERRPAIKADTETFLASPGELMSNETVIFRGENFRTHYYGGSNPTSLIAHVGCSGPLLWS
jgi:hypothetical protein